MSAFNTLTAKASCPICSSEQLFTAQFKYGDTWQHQYVLGDTICWGGNDIGVPRASLVAVEAIADCPNCGAKFLQFDIVVKRDILIELRPQRCDRLHQKTLGYAILDKS